MVPDCSADHRDSSDAVRVVDALVVQVVRFHRLFISVYSAMLGSTVDTKFCVSLRRISRFYVKRRITDLEVDSRLSGVSPVTCSWRRLMST